METRCPICKAEEEIVAHLFHECNFTKKVYAKVGITNPSAHANQEWTDWLATTFNKTEQHDSLLVIAMWAVWYNRNKCHHDGITETSRSVACFTLAYFKDI